MRPLVFLLALFLSPTAPAVGKEMDKITLECVEKGSIFSDDASVVLVQIDLKEHEVKVNGEAHPIATLSDGFITWVQSSDLAFRFFAWNHFNKEIHSWLARPWDDYMTGRWKRRGTHIVWTCKSVDP